jgi:hypothetical protein
MPQLNITIDYEGDEEELILDFQEQFQRDVTEAVPCRYRSTLTEGGATTYTLKAPQKGCNFEIFDVDGPDQ